MPLNGVRHNALFVTDLNSVPLKDLTADDNGSWDISTLRRMYKVVESGNKGNISVRRGNSAGPDVYARYRQYGSHKATKKQKVWSSNGLQGRVRTGHGKPGKSWNL